MSDNESTEFKVAAMMTLPRYENVYCRNVIDAALRECGVPLHTAQGVFYAQCMQRMFTRAIENDIDIAITIDFDSVFTGKDVMALLQTMAMHPEIDACACMQARRGQHYPLMTIKGETKVEWDGKPLQVSTAHFGLTAIRLSKLPAMEKPWFWSTPGEDGSLEDESGKIDDDIYFWKKWTAAGNNLFVNPNICIGHMEEMVAIHDENMQVVHMYPKAWKQWATGGERDAQVAIAAKEEEVEQSKT
jgi:hypothetical protein